MTNTNADKVKEILKDFQIVEWTMINDIKDSDERINRRLDSFAFKINNIYKTIIEEKDQIIQEKEKEIESLKIDRGFFSIDNDMKDNIIQDNEEEIKKLIERFEITRKEYLDNKIKELKKKLKCHSKQ